MDGGDGRIIRSVNKLKATDGLTSLHYTSAVKYRLFTPCFFYCHAFFIRCYYCVILRLGKSPAVTFCMQCVVCYSYRNIMGDYFISFLKGSVCYLLKKTLEIITHKYGDFWLFLVRERQKHMHSTKILENTKLHTHTRARNKYIHVFILFLTVYTIFF